MKNAFHYNKYLFLLPFGFAFALFIVYGAQYKSGRRLERCVDYMYRINILREGRAKPAASFAYLDLGDAAKAGIKIIPKCGDVDGVIMTMPAGVVEHETVETLIHDRESVDAIYRFFLADRRNIMLTKHYSRNDISNLKMYEYDSLSQLPSFLYVSDDDNIVSEIIDCRRAGDNIIRTCIMYFDHRDLGVDVTFDIKILPHWESLKNAVDRILMEAYKV